MKRAPQAKKPRPAKRPAPQETVELVAAPLPDGRALTLDLHWKDGRIAGARLGLAAKARPSASPSPEAEAVAAGMARIIAGKDADFSDLPLDWEGLTPFTRAVLEALFRRVPCGATVTYGQLADMAGHPGKARAVGGAMARNPWPLLVPCHRVLGADGSLTGYTNPHGLDLKALLLGLECQGGGGEG